MSRSKKKAPFTAITLATSEKEDKSLANRRLRRINKSILNKDQDDVTLKKQREVSNVWAFDKDGKYRFDPLTEFKKFRK